MKKLVTLLVFGYLMACSSSDADQAQIVDTGGDDPVFYFGADLSYVNEMEDCGAAYKNQEGSEMDPYQIFENAGTNLIRLRLWHNPTWTNYSNYEDVKKSIKRAKDLGIDVLLDFHYSDNWADPGKQKIPQAWYAHLNNTSVLVDSIYNYTYGTLEGLADENLLPDMVQVGNEINAMILQDDELQWPIDWARNSALINSGIQAVRDIAEEHNKNIDVMLHIAQPENGLWWFEQASANGINDFDWIGLSYYPIWSEYDLEDISTPLRTLKNTYKKRVMIVETAYPYTLDNVDPANNILTSAAAISGYPISPEGQLAYLNKLKEEIEEAGGEGLVYWEPAWVSTSCSTQWGQGSHWDNATLFDQTNQATIAMTFYNGSDQD